MTEFRCWSCYHTNCSERRCNLSRDGWPDIGSGCPAFEYDPGSDYVELKWLDEEGEYDD